MKRHVVERCIYGVDLDPLAVELAKTALWVETMDPKLPLGFFDHKLKCGQSQALIKQAAFDFQINPTNPGFSFHKLDRARDKNFWSFRVNQDLRIIVHRSESSLVLCYADHHDAAYAWAEVRRLETHPQTGVATMTCFHSLME